MSIRNTTLTLAALGLIGALATVPDAASQSGTGQRTWTITPSPVAPAPTTPTTPNTVDPKFVQCPLVRARTEIVTKLPTGWWQTPFEGPLVATRVQMMGSDKVLICEYQAYGSSAPVMFKVPASSSCVAVTGGFNCR
jgi:hypothetical protein